MSMYYSRIYLFFYWSSNKLIINGRTGFIIFVVSGKMKYLWRRLLDKLRDLHRSRKKMSRFYFGERLLSNRLIRKQQSLPDINNAHSTVCRWQIIMIPIVLNNFFSFQTSLCVCEPLVFLTWQSLSCDYFTTCIFKWWQ